MSIITEPRQKSGLTVTEAAQMLGCGKTTLYDALSAPEGSSRPSVIDLGWTQLRVLRIGRRVIVPRAEIERVLCEREAS